MEKRNLLICGDIHGELPTLVFKAPENSDILIVGDIGVGFGKPKGFEVLVESVSKKMEKKDIKIWAIRGNHDNPEYFDGRLVGDRVTLLKDHEPITINGLLVYPIGGATSHDIGWRLKSSKQIWWEGECIVQIDKTLPKKIDIMLSHDAPTYFNPPMIRPDDMSYETYEKIRKDRKYLSSLLSESNISHWYYGHYHTTMSGTYGNCHWRCLEPLELISHANT